MQRLILLIALIVQASHVLGLAEAIPSPSVTCAAIKPAPSGCGIHGNVVYDKQERYPIGEPQIVPSVEECASFCERRLESKEYYGYFPYGGYSYQPYCTSFEYNLDTRFCQLGSLDVITNVKPAAKSRNLFYNTGCFDCGKVCTAQQPFGNQLIDNGDFQDPLLGPWDSYHGNLGKGYQSSKAFHCSEEYTSSCFLSQEVNMCKGEYYALQFDYLIVYTNTSRKAPRFNLGFGGYYYFGPDGTGALTYHGSSTNTNPNAWKTVRAYFEYNLGEHSGPYFRFGGGGSISIDNVYVSRVPSKPALVPSGKNLFKNAGFESGDLGPWTTHKYQYGDYPLVNPPFQIVSPGINSKYALSFTSTTAYASYASMYLEQTLSTKPNTTYLVSFDIQITKQPFTLNVFTGPANALYKNIRRWKVGNYTFSVPVFTTESSTLVRFQVDESAQHYVGHVVMDNFKMIEIAKSTFFP